MINLNCIQIYMLSNCYIKWLTKYCHREIRFNSKLHVSVNGHEVIVMVIGETKLNYKINLV